MDETEGALGVVFLLTLGSLFGVLSLCFRASHSGAEDTLDLSIANQIKSRFRVSSFSSTSVGHPQLRIIGGVQGYNLFSLGFGSQGHHHIN